MAVIVTFCWLTGWHQADSAWQLVTSDKGTCMNTLPFSAHYAGRFLVLRVCIVSDTYCCYSWSIVLCDIQCTKGTYCIGYLLLLQLEYCAVWYSVYWGYVLYRILIAITAGVLCCVILSVLRVRIVSDTYCYYSWSIVLCDIQCTEGTYCIRYLLLLQLDCPVYTCGQLHNLRIVGVLWRDKCFMLLWEGSIYMAQNVNRRGQYIHGSECKQERAVYTWLRM
jgi:hypothetical protein